MNDMIKIIMLVIKILLTKQNNNNANDLIAGESDAAATINGRPIDAIVPPNIS